MGSDDQTVHGLTLRQINDRNLIQSRDSHTGSPVGQHWDRAWRIADQNQGLLPDCVLNNSRDGDGIIVCQADQQRFSVHPRHIDGSGTTGVFTDHRASIEVRQ